MCSQCIINTLVVCRLQKSVTALSLNKNHTCCFLKKDDEYEAEVKLLDLL